MFERLKSFTQECIRVFRLTTKPSKEEFKTILKEQMSGGKICGDIIDTQVEIAPGESNDPYDYDLPGGPGESRPVPTNEGSLWI